MFYFFFCYSSLTGEVFSRINLTFCFKFVREATHKLEEKFYVLSVTGKWILDQIDEFTQ